MMTELTAYITSQPRQRSLSAFRTDSWMGEDDDARWTKVSTFDHHAPVGTRPLPPLPLSLAPGRALTTIMKGDE
jgi:hypothetical protein